MEEIKEKLPELDSPGGSAEAQAEERPVFTPDLIEKIAAFVLYPLAFLYVRNLWTIAEELSPWDDQFLMRFWLLVFFVGFIVLAELLYRGVRRPWESWVWFGCAVVCLISLLLIHGRIWPDGAKTAFLHVFSVWWLLSRSGRLYEGESGHLLPLDALNGYVGIPVRDFFLRIRTVFHTLTHLGRGRSTSASTLGWSALALAAAAGLFGIAAGLLIKADSGFAQMLEGVSGLFRFHLDWELVVDVLFSLPVGAYLFGLLDGTARTDPEKLREEGRRFCTGLERLRRVPDGVWGVLMGVFVLFYAAFFALQFRYLFGAFTRTLPEGFIVSQYAREGFFELCKVMAVNFLLLWLVVRSARERAGKSRSLRIFTLALLAESLLFSVVAASKLILYIDCFGFTPRRLQSCWLIGSLAFGCVCAGVSLLQEKRTFRIWMIFSTVTAALLTLD